MTYPHIEVITLVTPVHFLVCAEEILTKDFLSPAHACSRWGISVRVQRSLKLAPQQFSPLGHRKFLNWYGIRIIFLLSISYRLCINELLIIINHYRFTLVTIDYFSTPILSIDYVWFLRMEWAIPKKLYRGIDPLEILNNKLSPSGVSCEILCKRSWKTTIGCTSLWRENSTLETFNNSLGKSKKGTKTPWKIKAQWGGGVCINTPVWFKNGIAQYQTQCEPKLG